MQSLNRSVISALFVAALSSYSSATSVAGAEAAATRQVQIGIESLGFSVGAIALPKAPTAPAAVAHQGAPSVAVSSNELEVWATWILANGRKARVPSQFAERLGLSDQDMIVRSTKTATGDTLHTLFVTEALGRKQLIFGHVSEGGTKGIMCLVGMDGVVEKAVVGQRGSYWELSSDEARRLVENDRALWRKQLAGIGNS